MKTILSLSILSMLLVTFVACNSPVTDNSSLSDVPVITPDELIQFESVSGNPFSFLGITSFALNDGSILIPDWQQVKLFKIDSSGELIEAIGREGNGPGEYNDVMVVSQSAFGNTLIFDNSTQKVIVYDSLGQYKTDFLIPPDRPAGSLSEIYEVGENQYMILIQEGRSFLDPERGKIFYLMTYNPEQDSYSPATTFKSRPYAISDGGASWFRAPYAAADLVAYDQTSANMFLYRSDENKIAKIDASLDTVQVISFELDPEIMTMAESDSIRLGYPDHWESMQTILPEYKALADQMMVDQNQNIWLKLNHASDFEQWLAISEEGELLQVIQLPKESWLTHISEHHLGVRLDDVTFALYEYPESLR